MCHEIAFPAPSGSTYVSQSQGCLRKRFSGDARPLARRGRVCAGNLLGGAKLTLSYKPPSDIFQLPPLHARRFMSVKFSERSEERRGGKECVSTCRFRWSP